MSDAAPLAVYVVDDDPAVRDSLSLLLSLKGYNTSCFASAGDFLASIRPEAAGCIMADVRMPGMTGLEMQQELRRRGIEMPVVIITAHGTVATAREAFKAQAVDFLEKPFDEDGPVQAVEAAFVKERARLEMRDALRRREEKLSALTERERQVVELLLKGLHHADIGARLGISPRTIEVHKGRIMAKLGAKSIAELVQIALGAPGTG